MKILIHTNADWFERLFIHFARFVRSDNLLFVGLYWSDGWTIRRSGFNFRHVSFRCKPNKTQSIPFVNEVAFRYSSKQKNNKVVKRAFGCCRSDIHRIFEDFNPDFVFYIGAESTVSFLIDEIATQKGIRCVGLQTGFMSNCLIAHEWGNCWTQKIQALSADTSVINSQATKSCRAHPSMIYRRVNSSTNWKIENLLRWIERGWRLLSCGVSFDTLGFIVKRFYGKIFRRRWFPWLPSLANIEELGPNFILVVINQPVIESELTLCDLLNFAVEMAPLGTSILLRPHPSEAVTSIPAITRTKLLQRKVFVSRSRIGPNLDTQIHHCGVVLTMNSALGVEALLKGKPVFTLAPAIYAGPGLAAGVSPPDACVIRKMIESSQVRVPDPSRVTQFRDWLIREHMISISEASPAKDIFERYLNPVAAEIFT